MGFWRGIVSAMQAVRFILQVVVFAAAVAGAGVAAAEQAKRLMASEAEQARWLAVGRLNISGQGYCTATLVAPDLVLTAAHCLVDRRTGHAVRAERVHFLAGFRAGNYAGHGRAQALAVLPGYARSRATLHRDLGLVRLSEPMPDDVAPLPIAAGVAAGDPLATLSYGIDRSQIPSKQDNCRAIRRDGLVLFTACEGVPGVSGAPIVRETPTGPELVAIASAVEGPTDAPIPRGDLLAVVPSPQSLAILSEGVGLGAVLAALDWDPQRLLLNR